MIKVLVVDDSVLMRRVVSDLLSAEPDITVIGTAADGLEALDQVKRLRPDVITLDVEMPGMDGLTALKEIMQQCPTPVIMLSRHTTQGTDVTIRALAFGAVDFIPITAGATSAMEAVHGELLQKIRAAAHANVRTVISPRASSPAAFPKLSAPPGQKIVTIGTSTGGPRALQEILTALPGNFPAGVVIVQHMPPGFTRSLADRLNTISHIRVKEAEHGDIVQPGLALIAPGDYHMTVEKNGANVVVQLNQQPPVGGHRPAVDPMMVSAANVYQHRTVGVILTGMGHDGAQGMKAIKAKGGKTLAEDQATAVIYGMPKAAVELGVVDKIIPLPQMAGAIIGMVNDE